MDKTLEQEAPKSAYKGARYILDCGKDFLVQQGRKSDAGELDEIRRKFQVIFTDVNSKYVSFFVHKAFIPHLGEVIGELIKIQFPAIKGLDEPISWMARVVVIGERNVHAWREKGFDEDSSDEVGITLEFLDLPLNRKDSVDKVLQWKWEQIKQKRRHTLFDYIWKTCRGTVFRFAKYAAVATSFIFATSYFFAEDFEEFSESLLHIQNKILGTQEQQFIFAEGGDSKAIDAWRMATSQAEQYMAFNPDLKLAVLKVVNASPKERSQRIKEVYEHKASKRLNENSKLELKMVLKNLELASHGKPLVKQVGDLKSKIQQHNKALEDLAGKNMFKKPRQPASQVQ